MESHPARGAWIETNSSVAMDVLLRSRTPPGVRGLKRQWGGNPYRSKQSHPARGAWIETVLWMERNYRI